MTKLLVQMQTQAILIMIIGRGDHIFFFSPRQSKSFENLFESAEILTQGWAHLQHMRHRRCHYYTSGVADIAEALNPPE